MRAISLVLLFFLGMSIVASAAFAQVFGATGDSPRSLALGRSDIAAPRDEWSPNPALPADTVSNIRAVFSPEPLGLPQSFSAGFSADIPLDAGWTGGTSFTRYQYMDFYSQQSFGVQTSKTFDVGNGRHAEAGLRLRYSELIPGEAYLPIDDIAVDLGASFDIVPQLSLAAAVTHLVSFYNNQDYTFEYRVAWLGLSYRATTDFSIDGTLESSPEYHPALHFGAEYAIDPNLFVRAGGDTQTGEISAGIGLLYNTFSADFAVIRHPDLGTFISFGVGLAL